MGEICFLEADGHGQKLDSPERKNAADGLRAVLERHYAGRPHTETTAAELRSALAFATFVANICDWDIAIFLTFAERATSVRAAIGALHRWIADLGKAFHTGIDYVVMVECQADGTPHLHGLLISERRLTSKEMRTLRGRWQESHGYERAVRIPHLTARYRYAGYQLKGFGYLPPENLVVSRGLRHSISTRSRRLPWSSR